MSYGGDRYSGGGGGGGESGSYYNSGNQFDDGPRRDDRRDDRQDDRRDDGRDQYGGGRDGSGRHGGREEGYGGGQSGFDRPSGGQGDYEGGRSDDRARRDDDYDRRFNQSGGGGRDDDRYGGGQSEGRYGEQGKPYVGPQSGQESTPYDAPTSGYDGPHRQQESGHHGGGRPPLENEVVGHADNDDDKSFFSSALSFLNNKKADNVEIDEGKMQSHHDNAYSDRPSGNQDSNSLGAAAAMHAFQMFTGGGKDQQASGDGQGQLLGMVFKEASKLFEQQSSQGNVQSGVDKQSVLNAAGKQAVMLYLKSGSGGGGGGGGSGLMGLASKFLK